MNIEKRFIQIKSFLEAHIKLVNSEPLELYPDHLFGNYKLLVQELKTLKKYELLEIENQQIPQRKISSSLSKFLTECWGLYPIPQVHINKNYPLFSKRKVSIKKQHEIERLASFIIDQKPNTILDIGSGAGLLSMQISNQLNCQCTLIDQSSDFQAKGKQIIKRWHSHLGHNIKYINKFFDKNYSNEHGPNQFIIGLHTCGNLSNELINYHLNFSTSKLVNIPCCYHKLNNSQINLSKFARNNSPLNFSKYAKDMAAKSYKELSLRDFEHKLKVKNYRYALHLFRYENGDDQFTSLGKTQQKDYGLSFSEYTKKYSPDLNSISNLQLESFINSNKTKEQVLELICLGILRNQLGRLVELYIVLDRVLYLQEANKEVQLHTIFDRNLSPRNLLITSHL